MVDFKKALANANKHWKKASKRAAEDTGGFQEYEDGRYTARLSSAKLGQSDSSGRWQIAFGWKFEDGDYEGKVKTSYQGIETEDNLFFLARDLNRLGYELPDDLGDLPEILKDIEKSQPVASIVLKTKGDFQNVYIRKVFTSDEEDEDTEEETEEEETDVEESDEEEGDEESEEEEGDEEESDEEESDEEESDEESEEDEEEESDEEEADEEESDEDDAEEVDIQEGMTVQVETAKGRESGKVIEILEKEEKVRVKLKSGKTVRVGVDKIEVELEAAAPKKSKKEEPKKKADPPPAKKSAKAEKKPVKKIAPSPKKKKGKK